MAWRTIVSPRLFKTAGSGSATVRVLWRSRRSTTNVAPAAPSQSTFVCIGAGAVFLAATVIYRVAQSLHGGAGAPESRAKHGLNIRLFHGSTSVFPQFGSKFLGIHWCTFIVVLCSYYFELSILWTLLKCSLYYIWLNKLDSCTWH